MNKLWCSAAYYIACLVCIIGLSGMRSSPVYGKLDFILLEGRPWWEPWRSMIEEVMQMGDRPILSDSTTSTVLRGVFFQEAVAFRFYYRYVDLDVGEMSRRNRERVLPLSALVLMLGIDRYAAIDAGKKKGLGDTADDLSGMEDLLPAGKQKAQLPVQPYRCIVNLRGFTPSWVPVETGHWQKSWAETSLFYSFQGQRGREMEQLLRDDPPANCMVYFGGTD